jgi:bifunctional NMN adenylyltransferase/nudix hydrolase
MSRFTAARKFPVAVLVGRWQLLHNGHRGLLSVALQQADQVVVVLGSSSRARDPANPFTWPERLLMIEASLRPHERGRVNYLPVSDTFDDGEWTEEVRSGVHRLARGDEPVALFAGFSDRWLSRRHWFPGWTIVRAGVGEFISSSQMRDILFDDADSARAILRLVPYTTPETRAFLRRWADQREFAACRAEHRANSDYRRRWPSAHHQARVVVHIGTHMLMVQLDGDLGHGLWALPGGYPTARRQALKNVLSELREESSLALSDRVLKASLRQVVSFESDPRARGSITTTAYYFVLPAIPLPEVHSQTEGSRVAWIPLAEVLLMEENIFGDHGEVLRQFLRIEGAASPALVED